MMMKKRLLALALCLVMMTSLLPITAAAETFDCGSVFVGLEYHGVYCEDVQFTFHPENLPNELSGAYGLHASPDFGTDWVMTEDNGVYTLHVGAGVELLELLFKVVINGQEQEASGAVITLKNGHNWSAWTSNGDGTHSRICSNGCVDSPQTEYCADTSPADCKCDDCGASMHTWSYEVSKAGDSLTATCTPNCPIGEVSVKLNAHSVTLPESPFNAKLTFQGDFKEVFHCSDIEYQYEDPTTGWDYVDPNTFTPKPGNYQAGVLVSGLPGNGGAAAMAAGNEDSAGQNASVYLFVKYTAADPAVTAQTGDNRPIELMMGIVVVFSALAAAAFVLDSKRKYSR